VLLGKGQPRAPVAGADDVGFLERHVEHALDRRADPLAARGVLRHRREGAIQRRQQVLRDRFAVDAVLDLDDRAIEHVEQHVVANAGLPGESLALRQVAAARDVAEEVALSLRARCEQLRGFTAQPPEQLLERGAHRRRGFAEARALGVAPAGVLEVRQLLHELLQPEVALELAEEVLEAPVQRAGAAERLAEQVEARVHQRLLLGDGGGGVVVGARVGDAAPEDVPRLVDDERLGGGRAQVDADERLHGQCTAAARFCLIIWK